MLVINYYLKTYQILMILILSVSSKGYLTLLSNYFIGNELINLEKDKNIVKGWLSFSKFS